ncbi:Type 1 phosphatases regulator ypi1 [Dimargaris verticillata]|uniref:Type 1 phosphatases regulator n=1 Tax=Dimargaris verticillata TaxID=2761393 RepID=A0A9W8E960_9FUNG|nr:Type 1 phosphatases regulator ypi1 [Dimargaris verticillata]
MTGTHHVDSTAGRPTPPPATQPAAAPTHSILRTSGRQQNPSHGSRTITITSNATEDNSSDNAAEYQGTLYLRAPKPKPKPKPRVCWDAEVVDNEGLNRKKSKVCCIFKKTRRFDESDSDESDSDCDHSHHHSATPNGNQKSLPPPNEYERMPNYSKK